MYVEAALAHGLEKAKGQLLQKDPLQPDALGESRADAPLGVQAPRFPSTLAMLDCHCTTPGVPYRELRCSPQHACI